MLWLLYQMLAYYRRTISLHARFIIIDIERTFTRDVGIIICFDSHSISMQVNVRRSNFTQILLYSVKI